MVRASVILLVFVVGLVVTLVVTVPVRILWTQLEQRVDLPVQPAALNGNLWSGQASFMAGNDVLNLDWQWQPGALVQGQLLYDLAVTADGTQLDLAAGIGFDGRRALTADGRLSLHLLQPLLTGYDTEVEGLVRLDRLVLAWAPGAPESAGGQAQVSRLAVSFPDLEGSQITRTPGDTRLRLAQDDTTGSLSADLVRQDDGVSLVEARWPRGERMLVRVMASVRDWLEIELPGGRRVLMETEWPAAGYLP